MATHAFEINNADGFLDLSDYLRNNKIAKDDSVIINVRAKDPFEYNEKVSSMINQPYAFCNFIKNCRQGVNGFPNDGTYHYTNGYSITDAASKIGECLTKNTQLNISFERIGNEYQYELPTTGTIKEAANKLYNFFITNSIVPGDSVVLKISEKILNGFQQAFYYVLIGEAIKLVSHIYRIPSMSINLSDNYFEGNDIGNSALPVRLSTQSGINFALVSNN